MKKLLLTLLLTLLAVVSQAQTEMLTATDFKGINGNSYAVGDYTSPETGITYKAVVINASGSFQLNNGNKDGLRQGLYVSENSNKLIIKSVSVTFAEGKSINALTLIASEKPFVATTDVPSGVEIGVFNANEEIEFPEASSYQYFCLVRSAKGVSYVSKVEVTYEPSDSREMVKMSFPETVYEVELGSDFESPKLICEPEEAKAAVEYESSDTSVATIDENGDVVIVGAGVTTIIASLPINSDAYYGPSAHYDLIVRDSNSITTILDDNFFGSSSAYTLYNKEDMTTDVGYKAVYSIQSKAIQFNSKSYPGSGVVVSNINPEYKIQSIKIDFVKESVGAGLDVYSSEKAFNLTDTKTATSLVNATKVNSDAITDDHTIAIDSYAFAIVPHNTGVIKINFITVNYVKVETDGSQIFKCADFTDHMICEDDEYEIVLPEDAPEIYYTSSDESVAKVENGVIKAYKSGGNAVITATWDAVPGKWFAGEVDFTIYVKYKDLKTVLENVHENQEYVGNFPLVVGVDQGNYNYVTDGTAWALFYVNHNHGVGAVIEPGWKAKYVLFNELPEFTNVQHAVVTDLTGEFTIKEYSNVIVTKDMVNEVLVLNDVIFAEETLESTTGTFVGTFNGQEITFYNQFEIASVPAGAYNVKCAVNIHKGDLQVYPLEYRELNVNGTTAAAAHVTKKYAEGDVIEFEGLEEGAYILYRHGGEDPDHTNVFVEAPANGPMRAAVNTELTYNHDTHPLTFQNGMTVKYMTKAPGKAPSEISYIALNDDGTITGVEDIIVENDVEGVYYNLQGVRVDGTAVTLPAGLYIRVAAGKATKVVVK